MSRPTKEDGRWTTVIAQVKPDGSLDLVYISEAHPNRLKGTDMSLPKNIGDRVILATKCVGELKLSLPVLIDTMDGVAETAYKSWPDRICVVDIDGKIAYYSERGPKALG